MGRGLKIQARGFCTKDRTGSCGAAASSVAGWAGAARWLRDILGGGDVSGFEGLNFGNTARTPSNVDEAGSTIKHILGKIENRRQALLAGTVDKLRSA